MAISYIPELRGVSGPFDTLISPLPPGSTVSASPLWTETSDPQAAALLWPKLGFGDKDPLLSPELAPASASVHPGPAQYRLQRVRGPTELLGSCLSGRLNCTLETPISS